MPANRSYPRLDEVRQLRSALQDLVTMCHVLEITPDEGNLSLSLRWQSVLDRAHAALKGK
jgi:hypothetical protein